VEEELPEEPDEPPDDEPLELDADEVVDEVDVVDELEPPPLLLVEL
jgi:hypothetical protein